MSVICTCHLQFRQCDVVHKPGDGECVGCYLDAGGPSFSADPDPSCPIHGWTTPGLDSGPVGGALDSAESLPHMWPDDGLTGFEASP